MIARFTREPAQNPTEQPDHTAVHRVEQLSVVKDRCHHGNRRVTLRGDRSGATSRFSCTTRLSLQTPVMSSFPEQITERPKLAQRLDFLKMFQHADKKQRTGRDCDVTRPLLFFVKFRQTSGLFSIAAVLFEIFAKFTKKV